MDIVTGGAIVGALAVGAKTMKAAAKFIDSIDRMTGGDARRKIWDAKADVKAAMIKAKGDETLADYVANREARKMNNTMLIVERAKTFIAPDDMAEEEPVGQNWLNRFHSITEEVSDEDTLLQELWAQILAGEVKKPKSYSLRTLDVLSNLSSDEAVLFTRYSNSVMGDMLISQFDKHNILELGVLSETGLITLEEIVNTYTLTRGKDLSFTIGNHDCLQITEVKETRTLTINFYRLSKAGSELVKLIDSDKTNLINLMGSYIKRQTQCTVKQHKITSWVDEVRYNRLKLPYKIF